MFGNRGGWGPLLIAPDTNLLIDLVDAFDSVESHFGLAQPLPPTDRADPVGALRDLFALWFFRDVRWVIDELYLDDSRKPLAAARRADRERVLEALTADLVDRGGLERATGSWDLDDAHLACLDHWIREDRESRRAASALAARAEGILPGFDGRLVAAALASGCHVFVTEDRAILAKAPLLFGWGLAVLRPGALLDQLEAAGELDDPGARSGGGPLPDLLPLARFYAIPAE